MNPGNTIPRWTKEKTCPHEDLYMSVHSNFIHNNPNWKPFTYPPKDDWIKNG